MSKKYRPKNLYINLLFKLSVALWEPISRYFYLYTNLEILATMILWSVKAKTTSGLRSEIVDENWKKDLKTDFDFNLIKLQYELEEIESESPCK